MRFMLSLAAISLLTACTDPKLQAEVDDLKARVTALEKKPAAPAVAGRQPMDPEKEKAAAAVFKQVQEAQRAGDIDKAKGLIKTLKTDHSGTRAAMQAGRLEGEIAIIGTDAGELIAEKWYQGDTSFTEGKATLLVFWEVWCPHCKREVPKVESTFATWKPKGLNVVGLTKQTRNITDDQVTSFLTDNKVTYPVAKEDGTLSKRFNVRGIPAAAVVKGGKIVWRGHPANISEEMLNGWVN